MIISVDAEKAFNKIQHPFPIKIQQRRKEGNLLNLVKGIYQNKQAKKHYSYYQLTVKDRMLSCYGEKQVQECLLSLLLFNIVLQAPDSARDKKNKLKHPYWKGKSKTIFSHRRHHQQKFSKIYKTDIIINKRV